MARIRIGKRAARGCCGCVTFGVVILACLFGVIVYINTRPITVTVPPYPTIKDNAYPIFVKAGGMTEKMKHLNPADDPNITTFPAPLRNYALAYIDSLPALKLMESALNKPCLAPSERSFYNLNSGFDSIRNLARVIGDDAEYLSLTGHPYEAIKLRLEGMKMGAMTANGGGLLPHLVSMAVEAICRLNMEKDIPKLTANQYAKVEKEFQIIQRKQPPFSDIIREEGNNFISQLIQIMKLEKKHGEFQYVMSYIALGLNLHSVINSIRELFQDKNTLLLEDHNYYNTLALETSQSYHKPLFTKPPGNAYMQILDPDNLFGQVWQKYTLNSACDTLEQTETAIYWYRRKTGRFPHSLRELVPRYLPSIPEDPFNYDKPLIYRLNSKGESFLLYSVGPDQVDNGGKPMKKYWEGKGGDIVAGYLNG